MLITCSLTIAIKLTLEIYKKVAFRAGVSYAQTLRQTVINSLRNVYGPLALILWFLGISGSILAHHHFGKNATTEKEENDPSMLVISCGLVFQLVLCIPFIINPGLR